MITINKKTNRQILLFFTGLFSGGGLSLFSIYAVAALIDKTDFSNHSGKALLLGSILGVITVWIVRKLLYYHSLIRTIVFIYSSMAVVFTIAGYFVLSQNLGSLEDISIVFLPAFFLSVTMILYLIVNKYGDFLKGRLIGLNAVTGIFMGILFYSVAGVFFALSEKAEFWYMAISFGSLTLAISHIYFIRNQFADFNEIVFNSLTIKSEKLSEDKVDKRRILLLRFNSFVSAFVFTGLLFYAAMLVNEAYTEAKPIALHISLISIFASIAGIIIYALWLRQVNMVIRNLIMLTSPVVVIVYLISAQFAYRSSDIFAYPDMLTPPFAVTMLYLCILFLLALRLGFEEFTLSSYFKVNDANIRLFNTVAINWGAESLAVFVSAFTALVIMNIFPEKRFILFAVIIGVMAVFWIYLIIRLQMLLRRSLVKALDLSSTADDHSTYGYPLIPALEEAARRGNSKQVSRLFNLLTLINPHLFYRKSISYINSNSNLLQELALKEIKNNCCLDAIEPIEKIIKSKYFLTLSNADLIREVNEYLIETKTRLENSPYARHLSVSDYQSERRLSAILCKYVDDGIKKKVLLKLLFDTDFETVRQAILSSKGIDDIRFHQALINSLQNERLRMSAFATIIESGNLIVGQLEKAFHFIGQGYEMQKMIMRAYEKIHSENANKYLFDKLNNVNRQVVEDAFDVLSKAEVNIPEEKHYIIENELEDTSHQLVWLLMAFQKLKSSSELIDQMVINAIDNQIFETEERIFTLLSLVYEPHSIRQIRKNRYNKDKDVREYAAQLLDNLLPESLSIKAWLLILLTNKDIAFKLKKIQTYLPYKEIPEKEVLEYLLLEEPKASDNWTKACAIKAYVPFVKETVELDYLISNLSNPGEIVKETAANVIEKIAPETSIKLKERYDLEKFSKNELMQIEITAFLINETKLFNGISGLWARKVAELIETERKNMFAMNLKQFFSKYHYTIVYSGSIKFMMHDKIVKEFAKGDNLFYLDMLEYELKRYNLVIDTETLLLKIKKVDFEVLLSEFNPIMDCLM